MPGARSLGPGTVHDRRGFGLGARCAATSSLGPPGGYMWLDSCEFLTARLSLSRGPAHCKPILLRKEGEDGFPSAWYRGKFGFEDFSGLIGAQEVCSQSRWERGVWEKLYFFHFTAGAPEGWEIDVGSYTWERLSLSEGFSLGGRFGPG